jgi:hypothetical protein
MSTSEEYRIFAVECLRWARTAKTEDERKAFLDMAQLWTKAAVKLTNGEAGPDPLILPSGKAWTLQ